MTTTAEVVLNNPLTGTELRELLRQDIERLLDAEGSLNPRAAFGRISYTLTLFLELDNPINPRSLTTLDSRQQSNDAIKDHPGLAAVQPPPLASPTDQHIIAGHKVTRRVTSPNVERLRTGQPVPVKSKQMDGTTTVESVTYPKNPDMEQDVTVRSADGHTKQEVEQKLAQPLPSTEPAAPSSEAAVKRDFWEDAPL